MRLCHSGDDSHPEELTVAFPPILPERIWIGIFTPRPWRRLHEQFFEKQLCLEREEHRYTASILSAKKLSIRAFAGEYSSEKIQKQMRVKNKC